MDVIIEVLCEYDSKIYVACRFPVWLRLCGSSINLHLKYFSRKTETLDCVGPAHDPTQSGPCSVAVVLGRLQSFLHKAPASELVLIWKRFRCLTKNLSRCFACPLSSGPAVPWHLEHQLIGCLVFPFPPVKPGAKRTVCKHDRTHLFPWL